ncbi:uncharacterized protein EV154DRAFT_478171 [Mucor mucedo]|uniref:uncharacterized protein n=1 Tax=Mucor mucedo TaxID=29922 RepID=UPI0022206E60|nr:uncharacterized protein EV154DRAFT_478171 [Mucor mucedo]KAI7894776.1 hypothetical protein EV154DRAFT_478171 [Mucor mucedo]
MSWYYLCYITDFKDKDTKTMDVKCVSQVEGIAEINYLEQRRWTGYNRHVQHLHDSFQTATIGVHDHKTILRLGYCIKNRHMNKYADTIKQNHKRHFKNCLK